MRETLVSVDNFARAETDAMMSGLLKLTGGVNAIYHDRNLGPLDQQTVIRQNRDTLYSFAIVDVSEGATFTVPEVGDRYVSVMLINQDHYINRVLHEAGVYELTSEELGSDYIVLAARVLFNPNDAADLAEVNKIQDGMLLDARSARAFTPTVFDPVSHKTTREALLTLAKGLPGYAKSFGSKEQVDPIHHLLSTASGWGGLPDDEAQYVSVFPDVAPGRYQITFRDVPADAFYSVSVYNGDGYFEPGPSGATNVNNVFGVHNDDGSLTVRLGDFDDDLPNTIPTPEGWNLLIRLYRPRLDEMDSWSAPEIEAC
ncbi:DUF1254 domain-containing protein [Microbacterium sp. H1-D42]|uniref:DUF1254 domain-containing protein n=1 Tax=Microbacterium sp. H1-D42 TaxID=2925844 RepID=UPI001F538655|nr:DUF1254 domain-containing protein [Microbacterium sp. H1-D42]UNK70954.1 DUF1254 domain-containing protein [Microbacterium sp. H1-D42]